MPLWVDPQDGAYRVNSHVPKHAGLRAGMKAYRHGLRPPTGSSLSSGWPSESGRSAKSDSSSRSDAVSAYVTGPATTMHALNQVWRTQGEAFLRPNERGPPPSAPQTPNLGRPKSCSSLGGYSTNAPAAANKLDSCERRCDDLLDCLVRDGADQWGKTQEQQARLCHDNRSRSQHSNLVRAETQHVADLLRAGGADPAPRTGAMPLPANWPNPIASNVPPIYQTKYDRFFGTYDNDKLLTARQRAKTVTGHERYRAISAWGCENSHLLERNS